MKQREFILLIGGAAMAVPLAVHAPQAAIRVSRYVHPHWLKANGKWYLGASPSKKSVHPLVSSRHAWLHRIGNAILLPTKLFPCTNTEEPVCRSLRITPGNTVQLGASLSVADIGTGPSVLRDYAQAVEGLGFDYLLVGDHVLGHNPTGTVEHSSNIGVPIEHARRVGTTATAFHDPFVLFGFLSCCTTKLGFASGILILAQRQAALVAKQAASLDELCGHRFRLGIGVGWNEIEFQGLGMDFRNRGRRSEEQVRFMQALWATPHTTFHGEFHHLDDAGLTLRPKSGRVPVWFGGHAEATFYRVARYGDGYMQLDYAPGDQALATFAKLRALIRDAGRKSEEVGLEVWVSPGAGNEDDWRQEITFWKNAGVTHVTAHTTYISKHHRRVTGRTAAEHLAALTRYRAAVADLL